MYRGIAFDAVASGPSDRGSVIVGARELQETYIPERPTPTPRGYPERERMRTYVRMTFHSEGASPLRVLETMRSLGFEEAMGIHDFIYKWKDRATIDDVVRLTTDMHERLKGLDVSYEITTIS
jgi:hypothetical protein